MNHIIQEDLQTIVKSQIPWERFFEKTFLVTGSGGFIASYAIKTLLSMHKKIRVIAMVRNLKKAKEKFRDVSSDKNLILLQHDVIEPIPEVGSVDFVIHAASYATPSKYGVDPVGTLLPNILGTYHMLEVARKQNVKGLLYISSGEVYGNPLDTMKNIPETYFGSVNPASVRSCYAESKRMGETMCVSWHAQYGVPTKIVRLFHTYGPGMSLGDGRVHSDFVGDVVAGRDIVMKSKGTDTRPFCYIADTVAGWFTVLLKGKSAEVYNVGSSKAVSISELAHLLAGLTNRRVVKDMGDRGNTYLVSPIKKQLPDCAKIRRLGWRERYTLKAGFQRTIDSYII